MQIFGKLTPLDLLYLSWTSKPLRGFLMRRSSISVWKSARSLLIDLPPCPPYLTEPEYAYLAFYPHCVVRKLTSYVMLLTGSFFQYCGTITHNILWAACVRVCKKCLPDRCVIIPAYYRFVDLCLLPSFITAKGLCEVFESDPLSFTMVQSLIPASYIPGKGEYAIAYNEFHLRSDLRSEDEPLYCRLDVVDASQDVYNALFSTPARMAVQTRENMRILKSVAQIEEVRFSLYVYATAFFLISYTDQREILDLACKMSGRATT